MGEIIIAIVLILVVLFCKGVRAFCKKAYNFLVELAIKIGFSKKTAKMIVNIIVVIIVLKILF